MSQQPDATPAPSPAAVAAIDQELAAITQTAVIAEATRLIGLISADVDAMQATLDKMAEIAANG